MSDDDSPVPQSITAAAVAAIVSRVPGFTEKDAENLFSDPSLVKELDAAYTRIKTAASEADPTAADRILRGAFSSEGVENIDEMMREIDEVMEKHEEAIRAASPPSDDKNNNIGASERQHNEKEDDDVDHDADEEEMNGQEDAAAQNEFSQMIDALSQTSKSRAVKAILPSLPLVAEYCGSFGSMFGLAAVCAPFRKMLFAPFLQKRLWIAMAITEYPVEVSELGEDAFLTVQSWSDVVRNCARLKYRKELQARSN